jgi:CHAT domain-containing protein/Flp pilus assembly protein TadD
MRLKIKFGNMLQLHPLRLFFLFCLIPLYSENANAYPKPTHLNLTLLLIAQTDPRAQAQQLFDEGVLLFNQGAAESLQQAITKWEAALPLWREVGDKSKEALTLLGIGRVYDVLGEKQQALSYYSQALPLSKAVGDRAGQATTLGNIGSVYDDLGEKQQALSYYRQALPLSKAVGDRAGQATTLNNIGGVYDALGEKQQALSYYNQALPLSKAVGDRAGQATTLGNIGSVYDDLGEKQQALSYYRQALPLSKAVGDRAGQATTLNNIGGVYDALGEKQQALSYYRQALPLLKAIGDRAKEAATLNNIGSVYDDLGEKQQALSYYRQALPLSKAVGDRAGQASTLSNIGSVYNDLGEKQQALSYYRQAFPLSKAVGDRAGEATSLNNIGSVYDALGEKQQALSYYSQALPLSKAVGDRSGEAVTLSNIGHVYDALGEKQQALSYYRQALPLRKAVGDRAGEATTLSNIGGVYDALGEKQQALSYYSQALPLSKAVGDRGGEATTLNNIGSVYDALGEKQQALSYYSQALPLSKAVGDRAGEAITLNNIGYVYDDLGEKEKALSYYRQALPLSKAVGDRSQEANTLSNTAYLEASRGNLQAALIPMQASIEIIEDLRTKVISPELRQTYFATVQGYYQFYIDLLMKLHQQNPSQGYDKQAFNVSERSRARTLLELLTEANAKIKEGANLQLLAQEKSLQGQLDVTEKQRLDINNNPQSTTKQKTAIDQQYKTLSEQYQDLQNEIRAKSPKYAAIKYPQPLTLEQVQQQILDNDTALLQYSLGKERSYLWVVTKEGMTSYQLPAQAEIEKGAENLLKVINQHRGNSDSFAQAEPLLSQAILAPAQDKLTKKRLLIVADGVLQYIPFSALSLSVNQQPLINQYEIVNLPSSSSLATIRHEIKTRKSAPKTLAILANPVFSQDDERVANSKTNLSQQTSDIGSLALNRSVRSLEEDKEEKLTPLPGTKQEAQNILKLVPENTQKTSAFDFDANLKAATNPQLNQYRIVHFATHGILNTESPELSGVVLSLVNKNGNTVNGFLRLNEIFNLKLQSDLVVVSACQTGLGEEIKGEGLVGLTRGFMYAGSPRLLVSLWKVDDKATAEFMTRFYRLMLGKKLPPAEALREAQLEMQQGTEWKSPYNWAAFVLQGEWR